MNKGKLIVEIEKADGEIRTVNLKIKDMTLEELFHAVGVVLNDVISKIAENEVEKVIWKAQALHDIAYRFEFKSIASKLEEAFERIRYIRRLLLEVSRKL